MVSCSDGPVLRDSEASVSSIEPLLLRAGLCFNTNLYWMNLVFKEQSQK